MHAQREDPPRRDADDPADDVERVEGREVAGEPLDGPAQAPAAGRQGEDRIQYENTTQDITENANAWLKLASPVTLGLALS